MHMQCMKNGQSFVNDEHDKSERANERERRYEIRSCESHAFAIIPTNIGKHDAEDVAEDKMEEIFSVNSSYELCNAFV